LLTSSKEIPAVSCPGVSNCILFVFSCSFHVGSGCQEAGAFEAAIEQARDVFDMGLDMGFKMDLLDIGGGFPGQETAGISFEEVNNSSSILDTFKEALIYYHIITLEKIL
jgi:diaminopimelate decarboxylase